jgi:ADP-ribose pyrophosphatase
MKIPLYEGKYLGIYQRGHWQFAERPFADSAVGILPVTDDGHLVLVEQYREPLQRRVIEIPAGLCGDEPEFRGEPFEATAARELLEETGFRAAKLTELIVTPTSAGMTSEYTHLFLATGLVRENAGGGTPGEDIVVHLAPLATLPAWLAACEARGCAIDAKIHACLWLAAAFLPAVRPC